MLKADYTIINDFKEFYEELPKGYEVVGPLFAPPNTKEIEDKKILDLFSSDNKKKKIFCSLGSSGKKEYLCEVVKALKEEKDHWNGLVLAPKAVCPIKEILDLVDGCPNIYVTDKFVPAPLINKMADLVISHGGQGTVQTAISSGTPIVGYAMQPEQQINLDNVVARGGAVRIPIQRWTCKNIKKAATHILWDKSYKESIGKLQKIIQSSNGRKSAGVAIWKFLKDNLKMEKLVNL